MRSSGGADRKVYLLAVLAAAVWLYLSWDIFFIKGEVLYSGDAERYERAASRLLELWLAPGAASGALGHVASYLPFSPSGEKPFFIFLITLTKLLLHALSPGYEGSALSILNAFSILGIAAAVFLLLQGAALGIPALAAFVIIIFDFDLFFHASEGYHTATGIFLFFAGILINSGFRNRQRSFVSGVVHGLAVFTSPHIILPTTAWYLCLIAIRKKEAWRESRAILFISGGLLVLFAAFVTYRLQLLGGIHARSAIKMLLWEQAEARLYGGRLPMGTGFLWEYFFFNFGPMLGVALLVLSAFAALGYVFRDRAKKAGETGFVALAAAMVTYVMFLIFHLPAVGRAYSPVLLLLVVAAMVGMAALGRTVEDRKGAAWVWAVAGTAVLMTTASVFVFSGHFASLAPDGTVAAGEESLASVHGKRLVDSAPVTGAEFRQEGFEDTLSGVIVKVAPTAKFAHSTFVDCEFEIAISEMMAKGLTPIATAPDRSPRLHCYLNEYRYFAFCAGRWEDVFPENAFLRFLNPGLLYYFDGDEVARRLKGGSYRSLKCPTRMRYIGPRTVF